MTFIVALAARIRVFEHDLLARTPDRTPDATLRSRLASLLQEGLCNELGYPCDYEVMQVAQTPGQPLLFSVLFAVPPLMSTLDAWQDETGPFSWTDAELAEAEELRRNLLLMHLDAPMVLNRILPEDLMCAEAVEALLVSNHQKLEILAALKAGPQEPPDAPAEHAATAGANQKVKQA